MEFRRDTVHGRPDGACSPTSCSFGTERRPGAQIETYIQLTVCRLERRFKIRAEILSAHNVYKPYKCALEQYLCARAGRENKNEKGEIYDKRASINRRQPGRVCSPCLRRVYHLYEYMCIYNTLVCCIREMDGTNNLIIIIIAVGATIVCLDGGCARDSIS